MAILYRCKCGNDGIPMGTEEGDRRVILYSIRCRVCGERARGALWKEAETRWLAIGGSKYDTWEGR